MGSQKHGRAASGNAPQSIQQPAAHREAAGPTIVELVQPHAYLAFLRWTDPQAGHVECVHVAQIHHQARGGVAAFAKIYPPNDYGQKGMANEILGYLVAHACDLPRAPFAFVAGVPLEKLPAGGPPWVKELVDAALSSGKASLPYPAFCTASIEGISALVSLGERDSELLRQDVLKWRDLPRALAFDDGIANVDRHFNNLLRLGRQRYVLIDHGRLVAALGNWKTDDLDPYALYVHRLLALLYAEGAIPHAVASAALLEAERLAAAPSKVEADLRYWLPRFLTPSDARDFEAFFRERMSNIEHVLRKRYNLLT